MPGEGVVAHRPRIPGYQVLQGPPGVNTMNTVLALRSSVATLPYCSVTIMSEKRFPARGWRRTAVHARELLGTALHKGLAW